MSDLLITINADAKNVVKAYDDIRDQTEDLDNQLKNIAKISAVGFAALTAEVAFSVKAFQEAEAASRKLDTALQTQGIFTKELSATYKAYAQVVEDVTGIDNDNVIAAQAVAQSYLGQTQVTEELTMAIANLATKYGGDLDAAATQIAKTIGTSTNAFAREGLKIDETATTAERYAKVLEFVNGKYAGQAEAQNKASGGMTALITAFGNLQELIGSKFAPAVEIGTKALTDIFKFFAKHDELANFTAALISAGLVVTALGVAIPAVVIGLGALKAAMIAAGIATTGTKVAVNALIGATGIGLLVVAVTEIALHWESIWPRVKAIVQAMGTFISTTFSGLGKIISGAFHLDTEKIKAGLEEIKSAFTKNAEEVKVAYGPEPITAAEQKKLDVLAAAAAKRRAMEDAENARKKQLLQAQLDLEILTLQKGSQAAMELKKAEIDTLKQMQDTQNAQVLALLQQRYDQIRAFEDEQRALDLERKTMFAEEDAAARSSVDAQDMGNLTVANEQKRATIEAGLLTEKEARQRAYLEESQQRVNAHNQRTMDTQKFGAVYASINQAMRSSELQGMKSATTELTAMQKSDAAGRVKIARAAAIASIIIKTAESAMNVFNGFSMIPIVGVPLGIAAAATVIGFGIEQLEKATSTSAAIGAAQGGLMTGGTQGVDSIPAMLSPGELVAPARNFEEVVAGVQMVRNPESAPSAGPSGEVNMVIGFDGPEASRVLTSRQIENRALGISVDGTV